MQEYALSFISVSEIWLRLKVKSSKFIEKRDNCFSSEEYPVRLYCVRIRYAVEYEAKRQFKNFNKWFDFEDQNR